MKNEQIENEVRKSSKMVADILHAEAQRQDETIELIASENYPSEAVMAACASCMMNKYTEGYSGHRYYGGCENYDRLEDYGEEVFQKAFSTNYHFNLQPHSGSAANCIAYSAVLEPGDTILAMDMSSGAHLTHSSPVSFVSKLYNVKTYGLNEDGYIDITDLYDKAEKYRPDAIVCGASAYPREIHFGAISGIAKQFGAYLIADIAHIAGLVSAGLHVTPFKYADIVTMTTQKTFRGPRGGVIACKPELKAQIDKACFPRWQGGALQNMIAGKVVAAEEACMQEYKEYIRQVIMNTREMAEEMKSLGWKLVTDGTDNHMFLVDLSDTGISGKQAQEVLEREGITLNKNCVPGDKRSPSEASGIRIGLAAMTTRGWKEYDAVECAHKIDRILRNI